MIATEELSKVSYLDVTNIGIRTPRLFPLWDGTRWRIWHIDDDGRIEELFRNFPEYVVPLSTPYYAVTAQSNIDIEIPFISFTWQHFCFQGSARWIQQITDDFLNMGASLAKIRLFHGVRETIPDSLFMVLVRTEVEYLLGLSRSCFDCLQRFLRATLNELSYPDLPRSYAEVVLHGSDVRPTEEIKAKWKIPDEIAQRYHSQASFFLAIREARTQVFHRDSYLNFARVTIDDIYIDPTDDPFRFFDLHGIYGSIPDDKFLSLGPWVYSLVRKTVECCSEMIITMIKALDVPSEIAPGYKVFIRSPIAPHLSSLLENNFPFLWLEPPDNYNGIEHT